MRASRMNVVTLREDPSEAEIASHRLLMRAGFLYKSGAGLYLYAPLMKRVLDKATCIVAEEISRTGGLEVTMPIMQEQGLWERSGRWAAYQATRTMLTVTDRGGQVFGLAPTAEEVVTDYASAVVKSYKQLPVTFFQQHTKFRDEIRPRFGLMRVKEFIMMDAYSFHDSTASLDQTYEAMRVAYLRTFKRLGLEAFAVEADTGAIGGSGSHEFMVAADVGEDAILFCTACSYAANVERAVRRPVTLSWEGPAQPSEVLTPKIGSIEDVVAFLQQNGHAWVNPQNCLKCVLFVAKTENKEITVAAFVPGDRQVNPIKIQNAVGKIAQAGILDLRPMHPEEIVVATQAKPGFAGPTPSLKAQIIVVDNSVSTSLPYVVGANKTDHHIVGFRLDSGATGLTLHRDDILTVVTGDGCPKCSATLAQKRGIEVGHIFKLGTKYSAAMSAQFTGQDQKLHPFVMGCYGIGTSRVVAAAVEQHNDQDGIRWPMSLAPYHCVVVPVGKAGDTAVEGAAQQIYDALIKAGIEAVLDDRDLKPGVKFKDWDLIGIPMRVVCGRGVAEGVVEVKPRDQAASNVPLANAAQHVVEYVQQALATAMSAADRVQ
jgi:prolyl-tRNA synthetase